MTQNFKQIISNTFGLLGEKWLENLPEIISALQKKWHLSEIHPISNMTYHFVAKAMKFPNIPVVIKIGCDKKLAIDEAAILNHFKSGIMVGLLDFQVDYNALLLEQVIPGHSLKSFYPQKIDVVMKTYANVIFKMHEHTFPRTEAFPSIAYWLDAFEKVDSKGIIDDQILTSAISKRDQLLSSMKNVKLLHGDLHLDNILENKGEWVCIDPKGVWGEPEFEIAAFDIFAPSEIETISTDVLLYRINKLAKLTLVCSDRLKDWFFIRLVLSAIWSIEDKGDPSIALKLASLLA